MSEVTLQVSSTSHFVFCCRNRLEENGPMWEHTYDLFITEYLKGLFSLPFIRKQYRLLGRKCLHSSINKKTNKKCAGSHRQHTQLLDASIAYWFSYFLIRTFFLKSLQKLSFASLVQMMYLYLLHMDSRMTIVKRKLFFGLTDIDMIKTLL